LANLSGQPGFNGIIGLDTFSVLKIVVRYSFDFYFKGTNGTLKPSKGLDF